MSAHRLLPSLSRIKVPIGHTVFTRLITLPQLIALPPIRASQPFILSPFLFAPTVLSPSVFGVLILSPKLFSPTILSPRVFGPLILNPLGFSPIILSPIALSPFVLSPGMFHSTVIFLTFKD